MTPKKEKNVFECYDCEKPVEIVGDTVKNGKVMVFQDRIRVKCDDCYKKNPDWIDSQECEVYSRIVGYLRPVQNWNPAKKSEFKDRKLFKIINERMEED